MSDAAAQAARRTRWPLLAIAAVLLGLLAATVALERATPRQASSAPAVGELPPPVLPEPVRCTRSDPDDRILEIAQDLRPDGRVTSAIVVACPRLLDGRDVIHVGEVVGDVLRRSGGAWAMVNDDAYALELGPIGAHRERRGPSSGLTVWLPDGLHEQLGPPGRHGRRGDIIRVEGVLLRADPADGGGLTVRATALEVIAPSVAVVEPLDRTLAVAAGASLLAALLAQLWARHRRRRLRGV